MKILEKKNEQMYQDNKELHKDVNWVTSKIVKIKKNGLLILVILALMLISAMINMESDIERIKGKIIKEHGYGMTIQSNRYMS